MKTTTPNSSAAVIGKIDINDIIFERKNREYGAYLLRSKYSRFLTLALILSCTAFILGLSSPLILNYVKGIKPVEPATTYGNGGLILIGATPPATIKTPTIPLPTTPVLITTTGFHAPTIKDVIEFPYTAPVDGDNLGTATRTANPNAPIDIPENLPRNIDNFEPPVKAAPAPEPIFQWVELMPAFEGGNESMMSFFAHSVVYPKIALMAGIQGKVMVQCIITKDGIVKDPRIIKSIGGGCDEEALRVVSLMPKWHPGEQNGRAVAVQIVLPIVFRIN